MGPYFSPKIAWRKKRHLIVEIFSSLSAFGKIL
jgi:hypothetical protein